MGMFDTFKGVCPKCLDRHYECQTKLFAREDRTFKVDDRIWDLVDPIIERPFNFTLELKNCCSVCSTRLSVIVRNGIFVALAPVTKPDLREGSFGDLLPEGMSRDEYNSDVINAMRFGAMKE